jgi:Putative auto-transporter adhesin, head GIN domain
VDQFLKFKTNSSANFNSLIMKKVPVLVLLVCIASPVIAQKVIKDQNAEIRKVSGYHAVSVAAGIDLYLSQGEESVAVSASEIKFRDRILTEVKDGVLKIWYDHTGITVSFGNHKMKAYVSFKDIDKLSGSGGSDIYVDGIIKANTLKLNISGGSDFKGKVEAGDMTVDASGGSDVHISGSVKNLRVESSGGSDFKGYDLTVDFCKLEASGGSDVYITVNKELSAEASGGSDVYYKGNGVIRDLKTKSSSGIHKTGGS